MSEQARAFAPETAEERDDRLRGSGYSASCAYWESLTDRQVQGVDPIPPFEEFLATRSRKP